MQTRNFHAIMRSSSRSSWVEVGKPRENLWMKSAEAVRPETVHRFGLPTGGFIPRKKQWQQLEPQEQSDLYRFRDVSY